MPLLSGREGSKVWLPGMKPGGTMTWPGAITSNFRIRGGRLCCRYEIAIRLNSGEEPLPETSRARHWMNHPGGTPARGTSEPLASADQSDQV